MNLPNKITMSRIVLAIVIIAILLFPFGEAGINLPELYIKTKITIELKNLLTGKLLIIASLTDLLDGYIARKRNLVTDFGKFIDAIADKILVNSVLIILAAQGYIDPIIPVVIILRDTIVNSIRMLAASKGTVVAARKAGKIKTATLMVGIVLTLFSNLPFELYNIFVSDVLLYIAVIMSVVSAIKYYTLNKKAKLKKCK